MCQTSWHLDIPKRYTSSGSDRNIHIQPDFKQLSKQLVILLNMRLLSEKSSFRVKNRLV